MCKINTQTTFYFSVWPVRTVMSSELLLLLLLPSFARTLYERGWGVRIVKEEERGMRLSFGTGYCPRSTRQQKNSVAYLKNTMYGLETGMMTPNLPHITSTNQHTHVLKKV